MRVMLNEMRGVRKASARAGWVLGAEYPRGSGMAGDPWAHGPHVLQQRGPSLLISLKRFYIFTVKVVIS